MVGAIYCSIFCTPATTEITAFFSLKTLFTGGSSSVRKGARFLAQAPDSTSCEQKLKGVLVAGEAPL